MILDPVSRYRIEDIYLNDYVMLAYKEWVREARVQALEKEKKSTEEAHRIKDSVWLNSLLIEAQLDSDEMEQEFDTVMDQERKKTGFN